MRLKHLESALSTIQREFPNPNVRLEQYPTSPELAAAVVWTAFERGDVGHGRTVLDLGCGTGMLTAAAALVESDHVFALDCDESALHIARQNIEELEMLHQVSFLLAQVKGVAGMQTLGDDKRRSKAAGGGGNHKGSRGSGNRKGRGGRPTEARSSTQEVREQILTDADQDGIPIRSGFVDTVLTNPPFGTKDNAGMDLRFLKTATRLARRAVYSFHKTSTRAFMKKHVESVWKMSFTVVAEMQFDIPNTFKFHKQQNVNIQVDLIRIDV
ncbi:hypothetical protein ACA910_016913 [Epithemia clementina (nom. ined.)]